ncbi:carboxypeptidase M32 [Halocynthiibacter sp.]|uniref:carboxypeptidase M32 n=1 Tax=Halocynthiibacter sp. TaxID=1979210 RepID=UPI003C38A357
MSSFSELMAFQRRTEALNQTSQRLAWDQETVMPRGATAQRAEEIEAMEAVLHARRTDPRMGDWIEKASLENLTEIQAANLRLIKRKFSRNSKIPADLAETLARETSLAQADWAEARKNEDFAAFAPVLERIIQLRREEGEAMAQGEDGMGNAYDALVQDYETGATAESLGAMFDAMRPRLVALLDKVKGSSHQPKKLNGTFTADDQMKFAHVLAERFGYDFNHGRIDRAVHPFSLGSGQEARITTRTVENDPFNCFYSTIHEVGHACYELGIDDQHLLTPLGRGISMGVHESQSRIYENQIGRSRAFTTWMYGAVREMFGDIGVDNADEFYGTVNRVNDGYIRTEADELQYNLHVLLRFDLEQKLISGELSVADLPEAWNSRFEADFGFAVTKPSQGCMQDVHWSVGMFGYFPTYSLGTVYSGNLNKAMRADLPDLDTSLEKGDTSPATSWLRENLHQYGGLRDPRETITHACGFEPSEAPLMEYLEEKFSDIYKL